MDVKQTIQRLTAETERLPDWDGILRDARRSRARWAAPRLAIVGVVIGLAALLAIAPWRSGERTGVLDRALAAVGDGSVLHVVFRGEMGGTLVSLESGHRSPIHAEREVWYDPGRELVHWVSRFGGVVEHEEIYKRKQADRELTALWQHYRDALDNGTARIIGQEVVDGVPVYWLMVRSQMLPDVADGKDHEFAQQVAISRETFKPVAMRYTRDRKAFEGGTERILRFETVSVDEADFTSPPEAALSGEAYSEGRTPISLSQAAAVLGRAPYWLGQEYEGLPLAQVFRVDIATGTHPKRLLRGQAAVQAKKCSADLRTLGRRPEACRGLRYSIERRGDDVYALGPVEWEREQSGVVFFYGAVGDNPSTFRKDSVPLWERPHVSVTQARNRAISSGRGVALRYVPPAGSVVVTARRLGYLVLDGVHISVEAENEAAVVAAARALRPMAE
jgi:hypothetical protein